MRAALGEAALEVGVQALGELLGQLLLVGRALDRALLQRGLAGQAEVGGRGGERRGQLLDGLRAVGAQRDAVPGDLAVPHRHRRARRAALADARDQRVALRERARVRLARRRARRPQRGDDLVEVRAAQRRRALDELEPVRQEHADERARRVVHKPFHRRAVDLEALVLPRLEAHGELVRRRRGRAWRPPPAWPTRRTG